MRFKASLKYKNIEKKTILRPTIRTGKLLPQNIRKDTKIFNSNKDVLQVEPKI